MQLHSRMRIALVVLLLQGIGLSRTLPAQETPPLIDLGLEAFQNKNHEKAIEYLRPWLETHPEDAEALAAIAASLEERGQADEALGYYTALMRLPEKEGDREWRLILQQAQRKVRSLDDQTRNIERIQRTLDQALRNITREATRREQHDVMLESARMLAALAPDNEGWKDYYQTVRLVDTPAFPDMPRGMQSMLNHYDFDGWEVGGGSWFYENDILHGSWGNMTYQAAKPINYTIRIEYQSSGSDHARYRTPTLGLHREGWRGAWVDLGGENAGAVQRTEPNPRYGRTQASDRPHDPPAVHLLKPAPFKADDWNTMEIRVRALSVQVDLNGQLVYEDQNSAWHGWDPRRRGREFPGYIRIDSGSDLQIRSLLLRPN